MVNFNKTQTVGILKFYHLKIGLLPFLQMLLFLLMNIYLHRMSCYYYVNSSYCQKQTDI